MRKAALAKQLDEFKDVKPLTEKEHDELVSSLLNSMKEEQNPSMARTKTRGENQFEHISMEEGINKRPSVKKELDEIKIEIKSLNLNKQLDKEIGYVINSLNVRKR